MFRRLIIFILVIVSSLQAQAQVAYNGVNGKVTFYSNAPLEVINATSGKAVGTIDLKSNKLNFSVPISSFQFEKSLMQEHFNEKYMESHRYPKATFTGFIANNVDISLPGLHEVVVKGTFNIHGVSDERTILGTIRNENNRLTLKSGFVVMLENHRIAVPQIVSEKIAEKIDVKLHMTLLPDKPTEQQASKNSAEKGFFRKAEKQSL